MPKKRKSQGTSESEEQEQYHVEVITQARVNEDDGWDYYVKWANYDSDNNTWEPEENLLECKRLLRGFWKNVGVDDVDYAIGHTVRATPSWIKKEKQFFAESFGKEVLQSESTSNEEARQPENNDAQNSSTKRQGQSKRASKAESSTPRMPKTFKKKKLVKLGKRRARQEDETDDSDAVTPLKIRRHRKKRAVSVNEEESESSTGIPLRKIRKAALTSGKESSDYLNTGQDKGKGKAIAVPDSSSSDEGEKSSGCHSLFSAPSSPVVLLKDLAPATPAHQPPNPEAAPQKQPLASSSTLSKPPERLNVQEPSMKIKESGAVMGIATKKRVAQTATVLVAVSKSSSSSAFKSKFPRFSKKTTDTNNNVTASAQEKQSPTRPDAARQSSNRTSTESPMEITTDAANFVQSPVSISDRLPSVEPPPAESTRVKETQSRPEPLPLPRRRNMPEQPSAGPSNEVDRFLSNIMPDVLAAPMVESDREGALGRPSQNASLFKKLPSLPKIPKKWRWSGELHVNLDSSRTKRLCNVELSDASEPRPSGLRFSLCLNDVDSLTMKKLHVVSDLSMILRACGMIQQYAKLGPQTPEDVSSITILATHMRRKRIFTYAHLDLDGQKAALLLMFPPSNKELFMLFKVPNDYVDNTQLIVVLVPWEMPRHQYEKASWFKRRVAPSNEGSPQASLIKQLRGVGRTFSDNRQLYRALYVLKFSRSVIDYMSWPKRPYCVWHTPGDGTMAESGAETAMLRAVLEAYTAEDVGYKKDVRAIFIHVGALASFNAFPALAERRSKRPDIQFYTYGTHESISPERWGIREIYLFGGVVMFTPSAVLEDIFGCYDLMRKIDEHPLWQCYILPSVVTMLAKFTCQGQNPLTLLDKGDFLLDGLLGLIENGTISLLRAPATGWDFCQGQIPTEEWLSWQMSLLSMKARDLLEECIRVASTQYTNVLEHELQEAIQKEIARDMWSMQLQPLIMDKYRRLVVVKSRTDRYFHEDREG
ncbi:uncharacterized protein LAESUDRAFT_726201, partial [Laetiporus sulphureus 93-53]